MESSILMSYSHALGAFAAIGSAFLWAVAALLFGQIGESLKARVMNLAKGLVAILCLFLFVLPNPLINLSQNAFWMLALSGLLGICIGDTLYFLSIQRLGARLTLLLGTLIPVVTAVIAIFVFDETMSATAYLALLLTIIGVSAVLWNRTEKNNVNIVWTSGLLVGGLFVITESVGILLTKWAVVEIDSMQATFIRQMWGIAGLTIWGLLASDLVSGFVPLKGNPKLQKKLLLASFIGAFLGTWLSVLALKLTYASVAVALNSISPIFVLIIGIVILKEKIPRSSIIGSVVAVTGVVLYFLQI